MSPSFHIVRDAEWVDGIPRDQLCLKDINWIESIQATDWGAVGRIRFINRRVPRLNNDTGAIVHDVRYIEISKPKRLCSGLGDFINDGTWNLVDYALGKGGQGAEIQIRGLDVACVYLMKWKWYDGSVWNIHHSQGSFRERRREREKGGKGRLTRRR